VSRTLNDRTKRLDALVAKALARGAGTGGFTPPAGAEGDLLVFHAGLWQSVIAPGAAGTVLTSNGVAVVPTYQALPAGYTPPAGAEGDLLVFHAGLWESVIAPGALGTVLTGNGAGVVPTFQVSAAIVSTTASFTQPLVGSSVVVSATTTASLVAGSNVLVAGGGQYALQSVLDATHVLLQNLGDNGDGTQALPGAVIAPGATLAMASSAVARTIGIPDGAGGALKLYVDTLRFDKTLAQPSIVQEPTSAATGQPLILGSQAGDGSQASFLPSPVTVVLPDPIGAQPFTSFDVLQGSNEDVLFRVSPATSATTTVWLLTLDGGPFGIAPNNSNFLFEANSNFLQFNSPTGGFIEFTHANGSFGSKPSSVGTQGFQAGAAGVDSGGCDAVVAIVNAGTLPSVAPTTGRAMYTTATAGTTPGGGWNIGTNGTRRQYASHGVGWNGTFNSLQQEPRQTSHFRTSAAGLQTVATYTLPAVANSVASLTIMVAAKSAALGIVISGSIRVGIVNVAGVATIGTVVPLDNSGTAGQNSVTLGAPVGLAVPIQVNPLSAAIHDGTIVVDGIEV
jgi:hypothetical protein